MTFASAWKSIISRHSALSFAVLILLDIMTGVVRMSSLDEGEGGALEPEASKSGTGGMCDSNGRSAIVLIRPRAFS